MSQNAAVGPRIRSLRLQRRVTLKHVADKAGITPSALSQIERDRSNPTLGTLKAIASALGTTIGHLFPSTTAPDRLVVRSNERKQLSPRRGITYELLTPDDLAAADAAWLVSSVRHAAPIRSVDGVDRAIDRELSDAINTFLRGRTE